MTIDVRTGKVRRAHVVVAVIKACFYDPQVNRTYGEMASHYDTAVLPARPRRPRDKAKVEAAVRIVERWLLRKLRNRRFYSLADVNAAKRRCLRPRDNRGLGGGGSQRAPESQCGDEAA